MQTELKEQDVLVKLSCCQLCDGIIRAAVKDEMTTKSKNEFMREVMRYNFSVKEVPLIEYRMMHWCRCP